MKSTNWSSPKTNIFAGINELRKALASGCKAALIREYNENCSFPIRKQLNRDIENLENWNTSGATLKNRNDIETGNYSAGQKHMMLTYTQLFGNPKAIEEYNRTGIVTEGNDFGMGTAHLVKREAMIKYLIAKCDYRRAACFELNDDSRHFVEDYYIKAEYSREPKTFKNKLWVVELLGDDQEQPKIPFLVHALNVLIYPFKFIPRKSVLRMKEYNCITYRIGDVTNGLSIQFHLPKKFSFN